MSISGRLPKPLSTEAAIRHPPSWNSCGAASLGAASAANRRNHSRATVPNGPGSRAGRNCPGIQAHRRRASPLAGSKHPAPDISRRRRRATLVVDSQHCDPPALFSGCDVTTACSFSSTSLGPVSSPRSPQTCLASSSFPRSPPTRRGPGPS